MDVLDVLEQFKECEEDYETLVTETIEDCIQLLRDLDIKGVVTGRTKGHDSLEKKLRDLETDPDFENWFSQPENDDVIEYTEMGDFAGVRIGLFLPSDLIKVARQIETRYERVHLYGTVAGGRNITSGGNKELESHLHGPWRSRELDGDYEYWEHYGYKSWQMVVRRKDVDDDEPTPRRVEIQVGTVVSQAWAEVQHNIIYKNPQEILVTPTMKRMIDAVNGLAITTELMLKELERGLAQAQQGAHDREKAHIQGSNEFLDWFKTKYVDKMRPPERDRWVATPENVSTMLLFCSVRVAWEDRDYPIPNTSRAGFEKMIDELDLTNGNHGDEIDEDNENGEAKGCDAGNKNKDIAVIILNALGYTLEEAAEMISSPTYYMAATG
ncbi:hypothetical protein LQW54_003205 [Pestalotiopsis sp. IQ-011]